ncbi:MAG: hypothetical protein ACLU80_14880 [Dorea sp.]
MSKAEIDSLVDTKWAGKNVIYYDETDSTNNRRAKEAGDNEAASRDFYSWQICRWQEKGAGAASGKSPSGSSIYV